MRTFIFTILFALLMSVSASAFASNGNYCSATGAAAIAATCRPYDNATIDRVALKLSGAASTPENVIVTLDSGSGAAYDTILVQFDPSVIGGTSFVWVPDYPLTLGPNDIITVTYTNTDTLTYGLTIRYSL
jgi:hypothetical protein